MEQTTVSSYKFSLVSAAITFILVSLLYFRVPMASSAMVLVLSLLAYNIELPMTMLFASMFIGTVSDLTMNAMATGLSSRVTPPSNWINMYKYFKQIGVFASAMFAGVLTTSMVLNTALFMTLVEEWQNIPHNPYYAVLMGFFVGAIWGVFVESGNAASARELMVFYKNTSGYLENRIWDGATIALTVGILELAGVRVTLNS